MDHRDRMARQGGWQGQYDRDAVFDNQSMCILIPIDAFYGLMADEETDHDTIKETELYKQVEKISVDKGDEHTGSSDISGVFVTFPCRMEVCGTCQGKGTHVNPSIDSHGITEDEWDRDWDDEDREGYFNGRYDVTCYECHGKNVVPVVNRADNPVTEADKLRETLLDHLDEMASDMADHWAECEAERRMGC